MCGKLDPIAETGLQFYGKITASVSHEIKNVLAIINENAGLLEDFTFMADRGKPIDPARLKTMAAAMQKQVHRADGILKNLNGFAHSIDDNSTDVDLNQTMEQFMALTERFAAMRGVKVDLQRPDSPIIIATAPFFLMHLLWLCLDFCMSVSGNEKRLVLAVQEKQNNIRIRIRRLAGLTAELLETFPSDREKDLLEFLAAELTLDDGCAEMVLRLSKNIGEN